MKHSNPAAKSVDRAKRASCARISTPNELAEQRGNSERLEQTIAGIDHCTAAKKIADSQGEKFLSYLLAMTIQESRAVVRRTTLTTPHHIDTTSG